MALTVPGRPSRRSLLKAGASSLLGVPLLAACGSGSSASDGRLILGTTQIQQFDPYQTNSAIHIHTFYTYLLDYTEDYGTRPAGAERWEFSGDHRSVTITLREQTFHGGGAVTADDVVAGLERAKDPEKAYTLAEPSAFIDTATAVDRRTVRLDFVAETPDELVLDWMFAFPLVPADRNDDIKLENEPAGSGPFVMESFERDRRLVVSRNPDYWDSGRPRLEEVEFRFFRDEESLVSALESGDVDGAVYLTPVNEERLRDRFSLVQGGGRMDLFFMNASRPPFDNKALRQALARAINRERIIEQIRFGIGEPIYTAFMPSSPAFDGSYLDSGGYDLAAAESMLRDAGGAREATAGVGADQAAIDMLQIIQADFEEIGFTLHIDPMEETTFLEELFASNLECCVAAQPNNLQSPSLVARGRQMLPTTDNVMLGENLPDAYVSAVEDARTAVTAEAQRAAWARLNEVLVDEAWAVGISTRPSLHGLDQSISGLAVDQRDFLVLTDTRMD
jgi:ABC-type transport system substrate-binding protein